LRGKGAAAKEKQMNRIAIALVALLVASTAAAQRPTVVYTNIENGERVDRIIKVVRETKPAIPVPASITTTPVLPRNWRPPLGPTSYVPPPADALATVRARRERPGRQPWYVNGLYAGPSPTGHWMVTTVGRPTVDVRIVGRTR
jgi:hypothetical protein